RQRWERNMADRQVNRREFTRAGVMSTGLLALPAGANATTPVSTAVAKQQSPAQKGAIRPKALMRAGHQHHSTDADLRVLAALGVCHICSDLPSRKFDHNWSIEGLSRLRERVERFGIKLDMVPLPLSSSHISHAENPDIMLGKSPQRDREIDQICKM